VLEIDVHVAQPHRLGQPQPAAADQTEQRLEDRRKPAGDRRGRANRSRTPLAVDVAPVARKTTEDIVEISVRLELLQYPCEQARN
jgi:hypothetical protein